MILMTLLRAVARLSPRMIMYQVKRLARNRVAAAFPWAYAAHIQRVARGIPVLAEPSAVAQEMARDVAAFYHDEYLSVMDDAAAGTFTFFGQTVRFGGIDRIDWHHRVPAETDFHLWRMKLGHMGFVCPMLMSGGQTHFNAVARIIESYRNNSSFAVPECFSSYWFPYSVSHRILAILSGFVIAQHRLPPELAAATSAFLRENVGFVLANIEHELKNNHVERNLTALCFYFTCTGTVPSALARRLNREVHSIVTATILPDGMQGERSAMYQGLSVMALRVFARTPFLSPKTRDLSAKRLAAAERAWALMAHPDGNIALFNDSWFGEVPNPSELVSVAGFQPLELLSDSGYARMQIGDMFAIFDAGPIGLRWNPGHGHADFLSAEVDVAGRRFLVDPGTYQYSTGPRRLFERSSGSHNGPSWSGVEPVGYSGCFKVGAMSQARITSSELLPAAARVSGVLTLEQGELVRSLELSADRIDFEDQWSASPELARVRLIVAGNWRLTHHDQRCVVFATDGEQAEIVIAKGTIAAVEPGDWACHYLSSEPATQIILAADSDAAGAVLSWSVRRSPAEGEQQPGFWSS